MNMRTRLAVFVVLAMVLLPALSFAENPTYWKRTSVLTSAASRIPSSGNFQYKSVDFNPTICIYTNLDATNTVYVDDTGATAVTDASTTTSYPIYPLQSLTIPGCTNKNLSARAIGGTVSLDVLIKRTAQ
jgi:hypothetical protein